METNTERMRSMFLVTQSIMRSERHYAETRTRTRRYSLDLTNPQWATAPYLQAAHAGRCGGSATHSILRLLAPAS